SSRARICRNCWDKSEALARSSGMSYCAHVGACRMFIQRLGFIVLLATAACSAGAADPISEDDLTGTTGAERPIAFQGYVYVDPSATDDAIKVAIARQVKTAIGALRDTKVSLDDRGARSNLDPSKWTRTVVTVDGTQTKLLKVTYPYSDRAVVTKTLAGKSTVDFTVLFGDYAQHDAVLKQSCSDDPTTDTDSLWYHYAPQLASCQTKIKAELAQISAEHPANGAIGSVEASR